MTNEPKPEMNDELRPEYDLQELLNDGVRGKYAERYQQGIELVLLEPDVHQDTAETNQQEGL